MNTQLFEKGIALRRQVMGEKHVAKRSASSDPFTTQQMEFINEFTWGTIWSRPGISLKVRSLVTLGMLAALNRPDEMKGHILGALNNGATKEEIIEVFVHSAVYCGFPASSTAVSVGVEVFKEKGLI